MEADLSCDIDHEIQIVDHLGAVDLDQQPAERRMVGHGAAQVAHQLAIP